MEAVKPFTRKQTADPIPPNSEDAEQAVIGSILRDAEVLHSLRRNLKAEHFFWAKNRLLYEVFCALQDRQEGIDLFTVKAELVRRNNLHSEPELMNYLFWIENNTPTALHADSYAAVVLRCFQRRQLVQAATDIAKLAQSGLDDKGQVLDFRAIAAQAQTHLDGATEDADPGRVLSMHDAASEAWTDWEKAINAPSDIVGYRLGLKPIDKMFGGFDRQWVISWVMPTSYGKTLLAIQCLKELMKQTHVLLVPTEMRAKRIIYRYLYQELQLPRLSMRTGKMTDETIARVTSEFTSLSQQTVSIFNVRRPTVQSIRDEIRRLKRKLGDKLGVVMIDSASNVKVQGGKDDIFSQTRGTINTLAEIASDYDVLMFLTWQANRDSYSKKAGLGVTSGRGGGDIENDSDFVFVFERPDYNIKTGMSAAPAGWSANPDGSEPAEWRCLKDRESGTAGASEPFMFIPGRGYFPKSDWPFRK